ncbi:MAG: hypothetical protein N2485_08670, partial [bacterium]|nr:hypothetical protein [bacterium]
VKAIKLLTSLYEKDDNKVEKIFIINKEKYEKMKNENYILVQTILNINLNNKITQIAIIYDLKCILFNITPALQLSRLRGNYVYDKKTNKIKIYIL